MADLKPIRSASAALIAGALLVPTVTPHAAPTGLNTIPTTDLVPVHQFTASFQNGNTSLQGSPTVFDQPQPLLQFQSGITPRIEGGIDIVPAHPPRDYRPQFNLKWKTIEEDYGRPAMAVGIAQIGVGFQTVSYVVASRTINFNQIQYQKFRAHHRNIKLRGRRVHAGALRIPHLTLPFIGTDLEITDQFVFYSDWISGSQNAFSFGGVYVIDADNSLIVSVLYGNQKRRVDGLLLNYTRTLKW